MSISTLPEGYTSPLVSYDETTELDAVNAVALWVILVGTYAAAMLYSWFCRRSGGWPQISFGWRGFSVACNR